MDEIVTAIMDGGQIEVDVEVRSQSYSLWNKGPYFGNDHDCTYRTRLSRAELRQARGLEPEAKEGPKEERCEHCNQLISCDKDGTWLPAERDRLAGELARVQSERDESEEVIRIYINGISELAKAIDALRAELETEKASHRRANEWHERELADARGERDEAQSERDAIVSELHIPTDSPLLDALEAIREQRQGWRMSSVCREKQAEIERLTAERDALKQQLAEAEAKLAYVNSMGLRLGMMEASDKPEPYLAHTWTDDSDHERMFREWSRSIGWENRVEGLQKQLAASEAARQEAEKLIEQLLGVARPGTERCQLVAEVKWAYQQVVAHERSMELMGEERASERNADAEKAADDLAAERTARLEAEKARDEARRHSNDNRLRAEALSAERDAAQAKLAAEKAKVGRLVERIGQALGSIATNNYLMAVHLLQKAITEANETNAWECSTARDSALSSTGPTALAEHEQTLEEAQADLGTKEFEKDQLQQQLDQQKAITGRLVEALKCWQHTWKETDCEYDDCLAASNAAEKAITEAEEGK